MKAQTDRQQQIGRLLVSLVCLFLCGYAIWVTGKIGVSNLVHTAVVKASMIPGIDPESLLAPAERARQLTPSDPDAHRALGIALLAANRPADAEKEFARAAALRPKHYLLWMQLGHAREQAGDVLGAIEALRESVRLAPFFAPPHWQLGNVLFRAGNYEEAFGELRRAVADDAGLLPLALELAWAATGGDAEAVLRYVQPKDADARLTVARFFARHGAGSEAVKSFQEANGYSENDRQALVSDLIAAKRIAAAYEVWAYRREGVDRTNRGLAAVVDGSFENKISLLDAGFGWQINQALTTVRVGLDETHKQVGVRSLRIDFDGESNPQSQILTQLVLVEANARYQLRFSALAEDVSSGSLPLISVSDASSQEYKQLGQSAALKGDGWREYDIEFRTEEQTEAIQISLQRQPCAGASCPIFGRIWLDGFSLTKG